MLASQPLSDLEPVKENKTEKMMAIFYQMLDVYSGVIVLQVVHFQTSENLSGKKEGEPAIAWYKFSCCGFQS